MIPRLLRIGGKALRLVILLTLERCFGPYCTALIVDATRSLAVALRHTITQS